MKEAEIDMGYKPAHKTFELAFEDYPGLEITCRGTSLGKLMDFSAVELNIRDRASSLEVFGEFCSNIVTWNIEHPDTDDFESECTRCGLKPGAPLPTDPNHLFCLDFGFTLHLIGGWIQAMTRVTGPKAPSMPNGMMNIKDLMRELGELQNPLESSEQI